MIDDGDDIKLYDPCPKCGTEMTIDGDGFEYCLKCSYHEADQGSGDMIAEDMMDDDAHDITEGFGFASDEDPEDAGGQKLSVFRMGG